MAVENSGDVQDSLFALTVEIYSIHLSLDLIETDIIEPFETGTVDRPDSVIGHEKVFFPAHEDVLALCNVLDGNRGALAGLLRERSESRKLGPV